MKILMTDLYKEYYFYELIDIQNRLNTTSTGVAGSGAATNILDSVLRTLIQQARNNFTREIYNKVEEITTEFPMSAIVEELNDTVSTIDGATGSFKIFDDLDTGINLYQFIKEKTHMMNTVGNAIHYNLELLKRLQNIGEYEGGDQNKILDETMCCKGIDEGVAIISNLIKDLRLLTGDVKIDGDLSKNSFTLMVGDCDLCKSVENLTEIYDKYISFKNDPNNESFQSIDEFNTLHLDSLGIAPILRNFFKTDDYLGKIFEDGSCVTSSIITYDLFNDCTVSRYDSNAHYRNYALTIIKMTVVLGVLYIYKLLECYIKHQQQTFAMNRNSSLENEIENILNEPLPKSLTLASLNKIQQLRKVLIDHLNLVEAKNHKTRESDGEATENTPAAPQLSLPTSKKGNKTEINAAVIQHMDV